MPDDRHRPNVCAKHPGAAGQPAGLRTAKGFFLIEVLVASMLLGAALAAMTSTLNVSLRNGQGALFRDTANLLARDIAERIHANPSAWSAYAHAGTSAAPANDCRNGGCDPIERARADIAEWLESLRLRLPGGHGLLQATPQGAVLVTISWNQRPERGARSPARVASRVFTVRP